MDRTEKRKFYEKVYFYELEKREQIYSRLKLPIAILTFMAPINFFLIGKAAALAWQQSIIISILNALIIVSLSILIYLSYCIYKVLTKWTYHEVSLRGFDEYYDRLIECCKRDFDQGRNKQDLELTVKKILEKNLTKQFMKYTDYNHNINVVRNAYIVRFIQVLPSYSIVIALFYLFLIISEKS